MVRWWNKIWMKFNHERDKTSNNEEMKGKQRVKSRSVLFVIVDQCGLHMFQSVFFFRLGIFWCRFAKQMSIVPKRLLFWKLRWHVASSCRYCRGDGHSRRWFPAQNTVETFTKEITELTTKIIRRETIKKKIDGMWCKLDATKTNLNKIPRRSRIDTFRHSMTKEDEINTWW